jgi:hypothetical protein
VSVIVAALCVAQWSCQAILDLETKDRGASPRFDATSDTATPPSLDAGDGATAPIGNIQTLADKQMGAAQLAVNDNGIFWVDEPRGVLCGFCIDAEFACAGSFASTEKPAEAPLGHTPSRLTALKQDLAYFYDSAHVVPVGVKPFEEKPSFIPDAYLDIVGLARGADDSLIIGGVRANTSPKTMQVYKVVGSSALTTLIYSDTRGDVSAMAVGGTAVAVIGTGGVNVTSTLVESGPINRWAIDPDGMFIAGVNENLFAFATVGKSIKLASPELSDDAGNAQPGTQLTQEDGGTPLALAANASWIAWSRRDPNLISLIRPSPGSAVQRISSDGAPTSIAIYGSYVYWSTARNIFRAHLPQ